MAGGKKNKIVINKADFKKNPALAARPPPNPIEECPNLPDLAMPHVISDLS